jgi:hypothetical protein
MVVTIIVVRIVATDRGCAAHILIDRASRATRVVAALIDIIRAWGIVALDFLDRALTPPRGVDFSIVPCIQSPWMIVVVICSITGGWTATVAGRIVATIIVVRHRGR